MITIAMIFLFLFAVGVCRVYVFLATEACKLLWVLGLMVVVWAATCQSSWDEGEDRLSLE